MAWRRQPTSGPLMLLMVAAMVFLTIALRFSFTSLTAALRIQRPPTRVDGSTINATDGFYLSDLLSNLGFGWLVEGEEEDAYAVAGEAVDEGSEESERELDDYDNSTQADTLPSEASQMGSTELTGSAASGVTPSNTAKVAVTEGSDTSVKASAPRSRRPQSPTKALRQPSYPAAVLKEDSYQSKRRKRGSPEAKATEPSVSSETVELSRSAADEEEEAEGEGSEWVEPSLPSANIVRDAYRAHLKVLLALPESDRQYLRVTPLSGWGNKIRALSSALKLALATERILLVDTKTMSPFYGPMFRQPFRPWFATRRLRQLIASRKWPHIEMRSPVKRNAAAKCWVAKKSLSQCVDMSSKVLSYASYFNMDSLIEQTQELRAVLERKLGSPLPAHPVYDQASINALLPRLSTRLEGHIASVKGMMEWDQYALKVGLHLRVFVDYSKRRVSVDRINPFFWRCVGDHVRRLQRENHLPGDSGNSTLVFVASDLSAAREAAKRALAGIADVKSAPVKGFIHTETRKDFHALSLVMTDWWLLGEADLLVGTDLSTFSPTAAMRRRVPLVLGSMKKGKRKCRLKVDNDLGTDT